MGSAGFSADRLTMSRSRCWLGDFPGGPVVKHLPSNAGAGGSIPGRGTKISPRAATTELACLNERARVPQTTEPTHPGACTP